MSLPRTNARHNERGKSNEIYEIKNRTVFKTHKTPTTNKNNYNQIYDFIKRYIVSIILLLYILASMAILIV